MEKNALACSHCNMQKEETSLIWKKCQKCLMLWCPKCAPAENQCANCIGGTLVPA